MCHWISTFDYSIYTLEEMQALKFWANRYPILRLLDQFKIQICVYMT